MLLDYVDEKSGQNTQQHNKEVRKRKRKKEERKKIKFSQSVSRLRTYYCIISKTPHNEQKRKKEKEEKNHL